MSYRYHTADVFTSEMFGGNQLAVLIDARGLSDDAMAAIAREFNLSETIFVFPPEDPSNTRKVRIFTPGSELPFAGHPTVGAAFVLAQTGEIDVVEDEMMIVLEEGVGPVPVLIRSRNGKPYFTQLTAARIPEKVSERHDAATIAAALSLEPDDLDIDGDYSIESVSVGLPFTFVPLKDIEVLRRARLNMARWGEATGGSVAPELFLFTEDAESKSREGVKNGDGVVRARMFGPTINIPEDPATGSACASLGGYLAWRSSKRAGLLRLTVHQGVEMGRPSLLEVETDVSDGKVVAVRVGGSSVLVASGTLAL